MTKQISMYVKQSSAWYIVKLAIIAIPVLVHYFIRTCITCFCNYFHTYVTLWATNQIIAYFSYMSGHSVWPSQHSIKLNQTWVMAIAFSYENCILFLFVTTLSYYSNLFIKIKLIMNLKNHQNPFFFSLEKKKKTKNESKKVYMERKYLLGCTIPLSIWKDILYYSN